MIETELQRAIKAHCDGRERVWIERLPAGRPGKNYRMHSGRKGAADLVGAAYGRPVALEIKNVEGRNRHETAQEAWGEAWELAGGIYAVVRSVAEAEQVLDDIRKATT